MSVYPHVYPGISICFQDSITIAWIQWLRKTSHAAFVLLQHLVSSLDRYGILGWRSFSSDLQRHCSNVFKLLVFLLRNLVLWFLIGYHFFFQLLWKLSEFQNIKDNVPWYRSFSFYNLMKWFRNTKKYK
jgi:hypothetical protein